MDSFFRQSVYMLVTRSFSLPLALSLVGNARVAVNAADTHNNVTKCLAMITEVRLHRFTRLVQTTPKISSSRVRHRAVLARLFLFRAPTCRRVVRIKHARMCRCTRVLHLKEVALLLYRSIARGESSWVRRPSGVRIRRALSLVSLLSLLLSRYLPPLPLSLSYSPSNVSRMYHKISPHWLPPFSLTSLSLSRLFRQSKNQWSAKKRKNGSNVIKRKLKKEYIVYRKILTSSISIHIQYSLVRINIFSNCILLASLLFFVFSLRLLFLLTYLTYSHAMDLLWVTLTCDRRGASLVPIGSKYDEGNPCRTRETYRLSGQRKRYM